MAMKVRVRTMTNFVVVVMNDWYSVVEVMMIVEVEEVYLVF